MSILNYTTKYILFFLFGIIILSFLGSCGIWDPADARKVPANVNERVKKNLEEGLIILTHVILFLFQIMKIV